MEEGLVLIQILGCGEVKMAGIEAASYMHSQEGKNKCMHAYTQLALSTPMQFRIPTVGGSSHSVNIIKIFLYISLYGGPTLYSHYLIKTFPDD